MTTKLNSPKYCMYQKQINLHWFVYAQLNDQIVLFQTIPFSIKYSFFIQLNLKTVNFKQFN